MTDIYAFDYNGTLNTEPGLEFYKLKAQDPDSQVGILTSNLIVNATRFSNQENIDPDFIRRGFAKFPDLAYMSRFVSGKTVYVGNARRDRIASRIAGWDYIDVTDL